MATNFPDTSGVNPNTGVLWADGDSYPDPQTGLTYYWYSPVWKTAISPTGATDDRYVEVAGDNMTGDLTLGPDGGPPEVQIRRPGNGAPALVEVMDGSQLSYISGDGRIVAHADVTNIGPELLITNQSAPMQAFIHANSHGLSIGGQINASDPEGDGTINLRADGSAEFAGDIDANNVSFNLEPDNEDNYTVTTDAEGNETRVYNGPTLDVKEKLQEALATIADLQTRIAALEAA